MQLSILWQLAPVCKEHNELRWCITTEASGRSVADKRPGGKQRRNCLVAKYNVQHNSLQQECFSRAFTDVL